jgi:hypothetical protein
MHEAVSVSTLSIALSVAWKAPREGGQFPLFAGPLQQHAAGRYHRDRVCLVLVLDVRDGSEDLRIGSVPVLGGFCIGYFIV